MGQIIVRGQNRIEAQVRRAIQNRMKKIFSKGDFLLQRQAEVFQQVFKNSEEFNSLKTKFKGEFGFTDQEVADLDKILTLLVPGNSEITTSKVNIRPSQFSMILQWVDFRKLKAHEFAQHELTRLDKAGNVIGITDIISWIEWLEEGATIRGYRFFRPKGVGKNFSRSGEGLMRKKAGGVWMFEPTRIFERIAKEEDGDFLRKGFGILVKRFRNG